MDTIYEIKVGIKNLFSLTSANIISRVLGMFIIIYLARALGPDGFGVINWGYSLYTLAMVISDMGIQTLGIRTIAQNKENAPKIISNFIMIRLIVSVLIFFFFFIFVSFTRTRPSSSVSIFYLCGLFITGWSLDWVFIGFKKMFYVGRARIIQVIIYALGIFTLFQSTRNILLIPIAFLIGLLGANLYLGSIFIGRESLQLSAVNIRTWGNFLKQSVPLGISILIIQIYTNLPIQFLGYWSGKTELGEFSGAYRVVQVALDLLGLLFVSIYPVVARLWIEDKIALSKFLSYFLNTILLVSTPFIFFISFLDTNPLGIILGDSYVAAQFVVRILVWSFTVVCFNGVFTQLVLLMGGHQMAYAKSVTIGAVISLLLNFYFITNFGAIGASIAYLLTEIIVGIAAYWFSAKYIKIDIFGVQKILIATITMFIVAEVTTMMKATTFVVIATASLSYLVVLVFSKTINIEAIKKFLRQIRNQA